MKLELKHLAPYLPYKLNLLKVEQHPFANEEDIVSIQEWTLNDITILFGKRYRLKSIKPILRPLSDLTKEIEVNGEKFNPLIELKNSGTDLNEVRFKDYQNCYSVIDNEDHELCFHLGSNSFHKYYRGDYRTNINQIELFNKIFEWHFDIFGLIEQGLAIDINDLPNI